MPGCVSRPRIWASCWNRFAAAGESTPGRITFTATVRQGAPCNPSYTCPMPPSSTSRTIVTSPSLEPGTSCPAPGAARRPRKLVNPVRLSAESSIDWPSGIAASASGRSMGEDPYRRSYPSSSYRSYPRLRDSMNSLPSGSTHIARCGGSPSSGSGSRTTCPPAATTSRAPTMTSGT